MIIFDHKISTGTHNVPVRVLKPGGETARVIGVARTFYLSSALIFALLAFLVQRIY